MKNTPKDFKVTFKRHRKLIKELRETKKALLKTQEDYNRLKNDKLPF